MTNAALGPYELTINPNGDVIIYGKGGFVIAELLDDASPHLSSVKLMLQAPELKKLAGDLRSYIRDNSTGLEPVNDRMIELDARCNRYHVER